MLIIFVHWLLSGETSLATIMHECLLAGLIASRSCPSL
jgi:hypothetical protein